MKYAVIQAGYAVMSIGETEADAIVTFERDAGPFEEEQEYITILAAAYDGCLMALPCTDALYTRVDERGGDISFDINCDGVVYLLEEMD